LANIENSCRFKREGRDVRDDSDLLLQFEEMQALHMAEWDRLRKELR
jgi:hypothetical protein